MIHKLKLLYELPPKTSVRLLKRKLTRARGPSGPDEIAQDPKLMRAQRVYDFLSRYEAILSRVVGWNPLEWRNSRVLELGCGPLLGFLPLAVFLGAESCLAVDPGGVPGVLEHEAIRNRYFKGVHNDLKAIYGPRMEFEEFMAGLREKIFVERARILDMEEPEHRFDVVLSNSCLEHVDPLNGSLRRISDMCLPDCRYIHLVDFGNHRDKADPFGGMYVRTPEQYTAKYGRGVNLLRAPDVLSSLREAGFDAVMTPYVEAPELLPGRISDYWTERYERKDLAVRVALFSSPGERAFGKSS
jgi:SAM-dependent methyltransferase